MIFVKLFRYLLGFVRIKIIGEFPERLLNGLSANGISVWNISKKNDSIELNVFARKYSKIKRIRKCERTRIIKKHGLPFVLSKYRMRYGMVVGAIVFFVLLAVMSNFIWNVKIVGNVKISNEELMQAIKKIGLSEGTPISSLDTRTMPSMLKLEVEDIAWAAVNIDGSVATVEITERVKADVESTEPSNLISNQDGMVVAVKVISGSLKVKVGDTVRKGDLLASGVVEYKYGKFDFVRAAGEVICRTRDKIEIEIPYEQIYTVRTGKVETRRFLATPFTNTPLFWSSVDYDCETRTEYARIEANGNYIPIEIITVYYYELAEQCREVDEETALGLAEAELKKKEEDMLECAKILSKETKITRTDTGIKLTAQYVCEKNIAFEEKMLFGTVN